ncbi:hypothetical protein BSLG_009221 [Batrachochytrium salamandrivorans]|nr:hypothetical protein BASA60_006979 [Batrachochytrium salamandrivorans]KAJ1330769.1 hypothetical protein BSLG_009221 [Batrachochytrium salamandrivorans]
MTDTHKLMFAGSLIGRDDLTDTHLIEGFVLVQLLSLISPSSVDLAWYTTDSAMKCDDLPLHSHQTIAKGIHTIRNHPLHSEMSVLLEPITPQIMDDAMAGQLEPCRIILNTLCDVYCQMNNLHGVDREMHETARDLSESEQKGENKCISSPPATLAVIADSTQDTLLDDETYTLAEPTFRPLVRWIITKAIQILSIKNSKEVERETTLANTAMAELEEMLIELDDQTCATLSHNSLDLLCATKIYSLVTMSLFHNGQISAMDTFKRTSYGTPGADPEIKTDLEFLETLMTNGYLHFQHSLMDSLRDIICDQIPFYESIHANVISALLSASVRHVDIGSIVAHLSDHFVGYDASLMYPYNLEDAMLVWTNQCLIAAKRYHQSKSQDSTSPNREIVEMAELDDLGQDLYDGRAINVLLMTYYPDETNELEPPAVWKPSLSSKQILSNWERVAKLTSCHMGIHRQILLPLDLQEIETQRKTSSSGVNTTSICALFISFMVDVFQVCCQRTPAVQVKMAATPRVRRVLKSKVRLHHRPTSASTAFDSVGTSDSAGDRDTPTESTLLALDSNPLTNAASQDQDDAESSTVHKNKVEKVGRVESISRSHHSQKEISAGCLEIQPSNSKLKHQPLTSMKSDKKPHSKSTLQTTLLKSGERVPCRSTAQSSSRPEETRASTETISNSEVPSSSFLPLIHSHSHSTTSLISLKGIDTTPPFEYSESSGVVSTKPKSRRLKLRDLSKSNDFTLPLLPLPNCRSSSIDLTRPEPTSSPVTTKPASEATHLPSLFDLKPELPHLMITPVSSQATLSNQSTPVAYRRNTLVNLSKCKSAVIQMPYETLHPNRPNSTQSLPSQPSHSEDPHYAGSRPEINTAHASGVGSCEPRRATTPHGKIMTHTNTLELLSEKDTATDHDPVTTRDNSSEMDARATRESQTNRTLLSTHGETQTVAVSNIKLFKALGDGIEQSSDSCKPNPNPSEKPQDTLYPCLKLDGQIHDSNYNNDQRERDDTIDSATIDCKDSASSGLCNSDDETVSNSKSLASIKNCAKSIEVGITDQLYPLDKATDETSAKALVKPSFEPYEELTGSNTGLSESHGDALHPESSLPLSNQDRNDLPKDMNSDLICDQHARKEVPQKQKLHVASDITTKNAFDSSDSKASTMAYSMDKLGVVPYRGKIYLDEGVSMGSSSAAETPTSHGREVSKPVTARTAPVEDLEWRNDNACARPPATSPPRIRPRSSLKSGVTLDKRSVGGGCVDGNAETRVSLLTTPKESPRDCLASADLVDTSVIELTASETWDRVKLLNGIQSGLTRSADNKSPKKSIAFKMDLIQKKKAARDLERAKLKENREQELETLRKEKMDEQLKRLEERRLQRQNSKSVVEESDTFKDTPLVSSQASFNKERADLATAKNRCSPNSKSLIKHTPIKSQSNRTLITNALMHVCLAGSVNEATKQEVIEDLRDSPAKHFIIVFRGVNNFSFRGLYSWDPVLDQTFKVYGESIGPSSLDSTQVLEFYKYDSGARTFRVVTTKSFGRSVHAVAVGRT